MYEHEVAVTRTGPNSTCLLKVNRDSKAHLVANVDTARVKTTSMPEDDITSIANDLNWFRRLHNSPVTLSVGLCLAMIELPFHGLIHHLMRTGPEIGKSLGCACEDDMMLTR